MDVKNMAWELVDMHRRQLDLENMAREVVDKHRRQGAWRTWAGDGGHGEHEQENFGHWKEHGIVENMSRSQDDMENR